MPATALMAKITPIVPAETCKFLASTITRSERAEVASVLVQERTVKSL
jgi:hypothetical protein